MCEIKNIWEYVFLKWISPTAINEKIKSQKQLQKTDYLEADFKG